MILAGDVGGTKTVLGLFDSRNERPATIVLGTFSTPAFPNLTAVVAEFARQPQVQGAVVDSACFGVAGPVLGDTARLTNVDFQIDANDLARTFSIPRVTLLNDLEAMAYAVPLLDDTEVEVLQDGSRLAGANMALIAAGTGLGEALLHNINGRILPSPTESGHADWAARNELEIELLRDLIERFGRASIEDLLSGPGIVNIHAFTHRGQQCVGVEPDGGPDMAARITAAALARRCTGCVQTLNLFVDAYGAEAGNLALRSMATGGVFIGGGIAPKVLPALTDGRFMRNFLDKAPHRALLSNIPVRVILYPHPALLGAAHVAATTR